MNKVTLLQPHGEYMTVQAVLYVPYDCPTGDQFIALVTRMRLAGAWDPENDRFLDLMRRDYRQGTYEDFICACVGFNRRNEEASWNEWVIARALHERNFVSYQAAHKRKYVVAQRAVT